MSDPLTTFGGTLTSGIQDISALLTLIGTEQCEKHIGAALAGGYLYVAATALSIFGSLGIVKAGIAVLIASISTPKPSLSFEPYPRLSFASCGECLLGARVLENAGFQLPGTVSPKIGMDTSGQRYMVETPLLERLEEEHLSDADRLSVLSKSAEWNVSVILATIIAAAMSGVPYIHLFLYDLPDSMHALWVFPFLRTMGSCVAAVSIQFIIQSRIISILKSRIIFMAIKQLHSDDLGQLDGIKWDENLPAEECLESLRQCIHVSNATGDLENLQDGPIKRIHNGLQNQYRKHFYARDRLFLSLSWIFLLLGIPATIAGYIGCFTLIANSRKPNGPLYWLGLEAALSIFRFSLWASNPKFDEKTEVIVRHEHAQRAPPMTLEKPHLTDHIFETEFNLSLVPEHQFLQHITPYTGPLNRFTRPENIALYYTWTGHDRGEMPIYGILCITVFDVSNQTAFTIAPDLFIGPSMWYNAKIRIDSSAGDLRAVLRSEIDKSYLVQTQPTSLIDSLVEHYIVLLQALKGLKRKERYSSLRWTWNLFPITPTADNSSPDISSLSDDRLCLQRGYEYHLKTKLMETWGKWVVICTSEIRRRASDWHNPFSGEARRMDTELEVWLLWERVGHELALLKSSNKLEKILHSRVANYVEIAKQRGNEQLEKWLASEFKTGQGKRLQGEREQAKKRIENAREMFNRLSNQLYVRLGTQWHSKDGPNIIDWIWPVSQKGPRHNLENFSHHLKRGDQQYLRPDIKWLLTDGLNLIDQLWTAAIGDDTAALEQGPLQILEEVKPVFVEQLEQKFGQRKYEQLAMEATIDRISKSPLNQLDQAYQYPEPSHRLAAAIYSRIIYLGDLTPEERAAAFQLSSATVYDVHGCDTDVVRDVMQKSTTRSVVGVYEHLVKVIPDNDHLFYVNGPETPKFVERNRNRWWQQAEQQKVNSWTFYFSPERVDADEEYVYNSQGTIAHIMMFIQTPVDIRLRLVHCQGGQASVSILEPQTDKTLCLIDSEKIPEYGLKLQDVELGLFGRGRHELELLVRKKGPHSYYGLRDILVEFLSSTLSYPSDDNGVGNMGKTMGIEEVDCNIQGVESSAAAKAIGD